MVRTSLPVSTKAKVRPAPHPALPGEGRGSTTGHVPEPSGPSRLRTFGRRYGWAYVFILPFAIFWLGFFLYPILYSIFLAVHDWPGAGPMTYVGVDNYKALLSDRRFWTSARNLSVIYLLYVPAMTFFALVIASVLNAGYLRLQGMWRSFIFVPHAVNMVAAGYTWRLMMQEEGGLYNRLLGVVGGSPIPWLNDPTWAVLSISLLMVWAWLGFHTIIMLAGLQTIPDDVLEAARVDGASATQRFFHVTVPLMRPVIGFSVVYSTIQTFKIFTQPFILTGGGPANATMTPIMQIFSTTFETLRLGYAAAMSWAFFGVMAVVTLLLAKFFVRKEG